MFKKISFDNEHFYIDRFSHKYKNGIDTVVVCNDLIHYDIKSGDKIKLDKKKINYTIWAD